MGLAPGRKITFVALKNAKPKVYSGTITTIDKANNFITIEAGPNKTIEQIQTTDIKTVQITDDDFSKAICVVRFASFIDADGHQQWGLDDPSGAIPDSAGVPPPAERPARLPGGVGSYNGLYNSGDYRVDEIGIIDPTKITRHNADREAVVMIGEISDQYMKLNEQ